MCCQKGWVRVAYNEACSYLKNVIDAEALHCWLLVLCFLYVSGS